MTPVRRHESRNRVLALLMAVGLLGAILVVATPQTAVAACNGVGSWNSYASHYPTVTPWGREDSRWITTCDGEYDYWGKVQDAKTDYARVRVQALDVSGDTYNSPQSSDDWVNYYFYDDDRDTEFRLQRISIYTSSPIEDGVWRRNWGF